MMTPPRLNYFNRVLITGILALISPFIFNAKLNAAEICSTTVKQTRYAMQSGEDFFSVLKNFHLEPVIGDGGSLELLQKINNMSNQTSADDGKEIIIPFKCEEQIVGWRVMDKGSYRLITNEKISVESAPSTKIKSENLNADDKTLDILNKDMSGSVLSELEGTAPSEDVSEAMRYRMICDGEWTGTECITRYSTLYVIGSGWYYRYDGTDKTTNVPGVMLSKLDPEIGFGWNNYWNENFRTDLHFSIISNELHPDVTERSLIQNKVILNTFAAGARYEVGKWGFNLGVTQKERLFYRFSVQSIVKFEGGDIVVNAVPIVDLHAGVSYMLHQSGKYRFDGQLGVSSIFGGSTSGYDVTPGNAVDFSFTVQHDRVQEYLFGTVKFQVSQQDTSILLQKVTELGFTFGYAWKLKDW